MSKHLIPAQRRERIREYAEIHRVVRSADLCDMLGVSEATIRRDLEWLEEQGILERTHGGAILSEWVPGESEYAQRAQALPDEKRNIGRLAASLVEDGDVVFINSGTTTTQVITHLPSKAELLVITNNVRAALELGETAFELRLLGGLFYPRAISVVGTWAVDMLRTIYASRSFIGVEGISPKYGCTVPADSDGMIVRTMVERTRGPVIVVADHSKWGAVSNCEVATLDRIHTLVTDRALPADARAALEARSVRLLVAGADETAADGT